MTRKKQKASFSFLQKKHLSSSLAVAIVVVILALSLGPQLTGSAIYDAIPSLTTIAVEEGASADDIIAISSLARRLGIRETLLTSELTGAEENVLIFQNPGGDSATISLSGTNIVVSGNIEEATSVLRSSDTYSDQLQSDTIEVVNGQIVVPEAEEVVEEYTGVLCSQIPYNSLSVTKGSSTVHFYEYGLYLCDTSSDIPVVLVEQYGGGNYPAISDSGAYVAYFQNYGIYLYEISSGEKTTLETTSSNYPAVSDSYVAYFKDYGIYVYDIEAGQKYEIEAPNSGCGWQPSISGNTLYYKCNYEDRTYDLTLVSAPQNNCVDSDGGDNPDEYGTLTGTDAYGNVIDQTDQCGSGTATVNDVFEKVCTEDSYTYTQHTCAYGCENGACVVGEVSEPICGDGVVDAGESCDDGNAVDGDGCTATCVVEVARECSETDTGVAGTSYGYDYQYNNYCYYYDYYSLYYYASYSCEQSTYDNRLYASSVWTECPSGCEDAAGCVDVETVEASCQDSDNGADQNTFGTTVALTKFGEERTIEDSCYSYYQDYQYVIEGYCSGTTASTQYILCDGICQNGVCVAGQEAVCADSDATDIYAPQESSFVLGEVSGTDRSGNSYTNVDECYDSYGYEYVIEQYCNQNNVPSTTWTYCQGGCENGVCVEPDWEQSCTDSDATETNAGKDIYTASSVSGINYYGQEYTYSDYCYYNSWDQKYYVIDYYCLDYPSYGPYPSSYYEMCTAGCTAGACDVSTTTATPTCVAAGTGVTGTDQYGNAYTYTDTCATMETLLDYSCGTGSDGAPYVATETACSCVEGACVQATMTVANFLSSASDVTIVIGSSAATSDNIGAIDLASAYGWDVVTDATITDFTSQNIVAVGGPYANRASRAALGGEVWDYQPGQALFFLREYDAGGATVVISGSEAMDTRNAVKLAIKNPSSLAYVYGVEQVS